MLTTIITAVGSTVLIGIVTGLYTMDESDNKYINGLQRGVKSAVKGLVYISLVYVPILIGLVLIGLAYLEWMGLETGIPDSIAPYYVQLFMWSPLGIVVGVLLIKILSSSQGILVHLLDDETGDFAIKEIPPEVWSETTVYEIMKDEDGRLFRKERDKSDLQTVTAEVKSGYLGTAERQAYEGLAYDDDQNIIYTSFLAGLTPRDIRSRKKSLQYVKKVLAWESDQYAKIEANLMDITRKSVKSELNYILHALEGVEVPNHSLTKSIDQALEETELEYLTDEDMDDIDDEVGMDNPAEESSILDEYKARQNRKGGSHE